MTSRGGTGRARLAGVLGTVAMSLSACGGGVIVAPAGPSAPVASAIPTATASASAIPDDEPWIVYQTGTPVGLGVALVRPDGTGNHLLDFGVPGSFKHPDWSPDGTTIVAVREDDNTIWTIGVDGSDPRQLPISSCAEVCDYPAFSRDGSQLAFSVIETKPDVVGPSAGSIRVVDLDGSDERVLARASRPEVLDNPRWSPDGRRLVIEIDRFDAEGYEIGCSIAVIDVATGAMERLTDPLLFGSFPDWGPQGIVFSEAVRAYQAGIDPVAGSWNLWLIDAQGGTPAAITDVAERSHLLHPSWSPDGRTILASLQEPGRHPGVLVDPATGTWREIAEGMGFPRLRPTS